MNRLIYIYPRIHQISLKSGGWVSTRYTTPPSTPCRTTPGTPSPAAPAATVAYSVYSRVNMAVGL